MGTVCSFLSLLSLAFPVQHTSSSTALTGVRLLSSPHGSALQAVTGWKITLLGSFSGCPWADLCRVTSEYLSHGGVPGLAGCPQLRGVCCRPTRGAGRTLDTGKLMARQPALAEHYPMEQEAQQTWKCFYVYLRAFSSLIFQLWIRLVHSSAWPKLKIHVPFSSPEHSRRSWALHFWVRGLDLLFLSCDQKALK